MCDHAGGLQGERVHAHVGGDGHDGRVESERPLGELQEEVVV